MSTTSLEIPQPTEEVLGLPVTIHTEPMVHINASLNLKHLNHSELSAKTIHFFIRKECAEETMKLIKAQSSVEITFKPESEQERSTTYATTLSNHQYLAANTIISIRQGRQNNAHNYMHSGSIHLLYPLTDRPEVLKDAWGAKTHEFMNDHSARLAKMICTGSTLKDSLEQSFVQLFNGMESMAFTDQEAAANSVYTFAKNSVGILRENNSFLKVLYDSVFSKFLTISKQRVWNQELFNKIDWGSVHKSVLKMGLGPNGALGDGSFILHAGHSFRIDTETGLYTLTLSSDKEAANRDLSQQADQLSQEMQKFTESLQDLYDSCGWLSEGFPIASQKYCPVFPGSGIPEGGEHAFAILTQFAIDTLEAHINAHKLSPKQVWLNLLDRVNPIK